MGPGWRPVAAVACYGVVVSTTATRTTMVPLPRGVQGPYSPMEAPPCLTEALVARWVDLDPFEQQALTLLGLTEPLWDTLDLPHSLPLWKYLPHEVHQLFRNVDDDRRNASFDEIDWNCFAAAVANLLVAGDARYARTFNFDPTKAGSFGLGIMAPPGVKSLVLGVHGTTWSVLIASVAARLLSEVWRVNITFQALDDEADAYMALHDKRIDFVLDAKDRPPMEMADTQAFESIHKYGYLSEVIEDQLFVALPRTHSSPYAEIMRDRSWFWTALRSIEVRDILPHARCEIGPWMDAGKVYGVWCHKQHNGMLPVIWAAGPQHSDRPVRELMAFINGKDLPIGIEFLELEKHERRASFASSAGRPAIFLLRDGSGLVEDVEQLTSRVYFPVERSHTCGEVGTWSALGNWSCGALTQRASKLGLQSPPQAIHDFMEKFDLSHDDLRKLYRHFRSEYKDSMDYGQALTRATDHWVDTEKSRWSVWFIAPPNSQMSAGRTFVLCVFGTLALLYVIAELSGRSPRRPLADFVDRTGPRKLSLELVAGTMDTINVVLRSVGVAALLCASNEMQPFQGIVLEHLLLGQFVAQAVTLVLSKYETPVHNPSLEIVPVFTVMLDNLKAELVGHRAEAVLASLLLCSVTVSFISGIIIYSIGLARMGGALRFMPYVVEFGIQGVLGIVLLDLGLEASCGSSALELVTSMSFGPLLKWEVIRLWLPALFLAIALFSYSKFMKEWPYTLVVCMSVSMLLFHLVLLMTRTSVVEACQIGWLYAPAEAGSIGALYSVDLSLIFWPALLTNLPQIVVAVFIVVVVNCGCQLICTPSVLPREAMGLSTFDYEMVVQGRAHILTGLVGGFCSDFGNDDTMVHRMMGGRYRIGCGVHLATLLISILGGKITGWAIPFVPKFVNGMLIMVVGFNFLTSGLVEARLVLARSEFVVVVAMVVAIVVSGGRVEIAMIVGILLGFADFIRKDTGSIGSPCVTELSSPGVAITSLEGFMYFATAPTVVEALCSRAKQHDAPLAALVVDWAAVTGIDTKGALVWKRLLATEGLEVIFCCIRPTVLAELQRCRICQAPSPQRGLAASGDFDVGVQMTALSASHEDRQPLDDEQSLESGRQAAARNLVVFEVRREAIEYAESVSRSHSELGEMQVRCFRQAETGPPSSTPAKERLEPPSPEAGPAQQREEQVPSPLVPDTNFEHKLYGSSTCSVDGPLASMLEVCTTVMDSVCEVKRGTRSHVSSTTFTSGLPTLQ